MVKVTNIAGDEYVGKLGNQQYQGLYGFSIRKKQHSKQQKVTIKQKDSRERFKGAVEWVKSLSGPDKANFRKLYSLNFPSYKPGVPANWYNYAKNMYLKIPTYRLIDPDTNLIEFEHPGILSVSFYDQAKHVIHGVSGLSSLSQPYLCESYECSIPPDSWAFSVETICGLEYFHFLTSTHTFYKYPCFERECVSER